MNPATTPAAALSTPARLIAARWAEWRGLTLAYLHEQRYTQVEHVLLGMRDRHAEWLRTLLARGVPMRTIRRHGLDDPRESAATLEAHVQKYYDRRLRRATDVTHL